MVIPEQQLLQLIPVRLGQSQALDDAVRCICSTPTQYDQYLTEGKVSSTPAPYLAAINSLQRSLLDDEACTASETMAAATLLQMYEHSAHETGSGWIAHANGVIKMLELRGSSSISNELERAILTAQVGNIFIKAIRDHVDCFLVDPGWRSMLKLSSRSENKEPNAAFSAMIDIGVFLPGILRRYEQLEEVRSESEGMALPRAKDACIDSLIVDRVDIRRRLETWISKYRATFQADTDITEADALTVRIKHATRFSVLVFSVLVDYILADCFLTAQIHAQIAQYEFLEARPQLAHTEMANLQLTERAAASLSELQALKEVDVMASKSSANLLHMMLQRVLVASRHRDVKCSTIGMVTENLFRELGECKPPDAPQVNDTQTQLDQRKDGTTHRNDI